MAGLRGQLAYDCDDADGWDDADVLCELWLPLPEPDLDAGRRPRNPQALPFRWR